jgi:hypothetical protein
MRSTSILYRIAYCSYRVVVSFVSLCLIVVYAGGTRSNQRKGKERNKRICAKERKYEKNKRTRKKRAERDDKMV